MPLLKSTPVTLVLFHQSQATLPGLIHDVSAIRQAGASRWAMSQLRMSASFSVMTTARQGNVCLPFNLAMKSALFVGTRFRRPKPPTTCSCG